MWLGLLWPVAAIIVSVLAPLNVGAYELNGVDVTGPEFARRGGLLASWLVAAVLAPLAFGIWTSRRWVRPAAVSLAATTSLATLVLGWREGGSAWASALVQAFILIPAAYWYFYRKQTVLYYYAQLEPQSADPHVA